MLLYDTNHVLSSDYSEVIVVGAGADAVDYKFFCITFLQNIVLWSKRVDYIRQSTLGFNDLRNDICKKEYKYFLHQFDK